jgi:hypothetical protein
MTVAVSVTDEDCLAWCLPIIGTRFDVPICEERLQPLHLRVSQPEKAAHHDSREFEGVNRAGGETSSGSLHTAAIILGLRQGSRQRLDLRRNSAPSIATI